jgi:hypothetical protein
MTTTKRNVLIAFSILFLLALFSISTIDAGNLQINGDKMHEFGGFSGFVVACLVGFVALFFALSITGVVLVVLAVVMVIAIAAVLGSIVIALLPLMIPVLVLVGIIALFTRRKTA